MATTPTTATTTPPSTPVIHGPLNIDYLNESWCELQYKSGCSSTGSISHLNHSVNPEVLEKLLQEAQKESYSLTLLSTEFLPPKLPPQPPLTSSTASPKSLIAEILSSPSSLSSMATVKTPMSSSSSTEITVKSEAGSRNTHSGGGVSDSTVLISSHLLAGGVNTQKRCADYINSDDCGGDEDVDLEYVDEEDEEVIDINSTHELKNQIVEPKCTDCVKHQQQIDTLTERQKYHEKQLIKLRKEYEEKILLNKSLLISSSSSSNEASLVSSLCKNSNDVNSNVSPNSYSPPSLASNVINSNVNTNENLNNNNINKTLSGSTHEYINYWSSRPQAQPPKEWNFVHPNSSKSKLNNLNKFSEDLSASDKNDSLTVKLLSKVSIGKIIFTHMASFIVGATLMFLVFRRHLNVRSSSLYFV